MCKASLCLVQLVGAQYKAPTDSRAGRSVFLLARGNGKMTWQRDVCTKVGGILTAFFANFLPQQLYLGRG